ncbi:energy transducer TonB [Qipengyuania sp. 6B39]|uniref:energy transducer TonB n=1 Tax=Qipengyuania proteolytica TaxID=2867239 RepID=UPI001C8A1DA0|nr:energy transducer TonB [Qipengyuania proteolytica]MBX7494550.1 energy transducer TonB [Qipengyuania proteolytica]
MAAAVSSLPLTSVEAAEEQGPLEIAPSTPWQVDFAESRCRAARIFGEGEEQTILFLEQLSPGDQPRWIVAGEAIKDLGRSHRLDIRFGPGNASFEEELEESITLAKFGRAFRGSRIREDEADAEEDDADRDNEPGLARLDIAEGKAIEWVQLTRNKRQPQRLMTGSLGQLFEILNTCMDDLVSTWGLDLAAQSRRVTAPKPKNISQVAARIQKYYPSKAERWGIQADLSIRVMVDSEGRATECKITNITLAEDFDDRPCTEFMRIAEFEPARDSDGNPMASYYVNSILYRMF